MNGGRPTRPMTSTANEHQADEPRRPGGASHAWAPARTTDAERNRRTIVEAQERAPDAQLPALEPGVTLVDHGGVTGLPVVQSLVLDHLLTSDGLAFWIDTHGHASTAALAQLAPSRRLLDRVCVARAFTPYQHYAAVGDLARAVDRCRESSEEPALTAARAPGTAGTSEPALFVAPAIDGQYREPDGFPHARTLLTRSLARLGRAGDDHDVPVLVTRTAADEVSAAIERWADRRIVCERTRSGLRFVGDDFETLTYPVAGGSLRQTTIAYWRQLLRRRAGVSGVPNTGAAARTVDGSNVIGGEAKRARASVGTIAGADASLSGHASRGGRW